MNYSLKNRSINKILIIFQSILWIVLGAIIGMVITSDLNVSVKVLIMAIILVVIIALNIVIIFMASKGWDFSQHEYVSRKQYKGIEPKKPISMESSAKISTSNKISPNSQMSSEFDSEAQIRTKRNSNANNKKKQHIRKIVLINEEGQALREWDIDTKSGLVIGKSAGNVIVDIDLSESTFADTISKQHAVLNYTGDGWYLDDNDSKNGTRVKKSNQNAILDLKLVGSVEVESGDIIYVSNSMLQLF
jgi:hypothetical protein